MKLERSEEPPEKVQEIFATFLSRSGVSERAFEDLCSQHPGLRVELEELFADRPEVVEMLQLFKLSF